MNLSRSFDTGSSLLGKIHCRLEMGERVIRFSSSILARLWDGVRGIGGVPICLTWRSGEHAKEVRSMEKLRRNLPVLLCVAGATGLCIVVVTRGRGEVISAALAFVFGTSVALLVVRSEHNEFHEEAIKDKKNPDYYRVRSEEFGREKTKLLASMEKICRALGLGTGTDVVKVLENISALCARSQALQQAEASLALLSAPANAIKLLEEKLEAAEGRCSLLEGELKARAGELKGTQIALSSAQQSADKASRALKDAGVAHDAILRDLTDIHEEQVQNLLDEIKGKDVAIQTLSTSLPLVEAELRTKEEQRLTLQQTLGRIHDAIDGIACEVRTSLNQEVPRGGELERLLSIKASLVKLSSQARLALVNERRATTLQNELTLVRAEQQRTKQSLQGIHAQYPWISIVDQASSLASKGDILGTGRVLLGQRGDDAFSQDQMIALLRTRLPDGYSLFQFVETFGVMIEKEARERLEGARSAVLECETRYKCARDIPSVAVALKNLEGSKAAQARAEAERKEAHQAASSMNRLLARAIETPILEGVSLLKSCQDELRGRVLCSLSPASSALFVGAGLSRPEEFSFVFNDDAFLVAASEQLPPVAAGGLATTLRSDLRKSALVAFGACAGEAVKTSYRYIPAELVREILSAASEGQFSADEVDLPAVISTWDVSREELSENREFPALDILRAIEPFSHKNDALGEAVRGVFARYVKARGGPKGVEIRDAEHGLMSKLNMSDRRLRQCLDLNFA